MFSKLLQIQINGNTAKIRIIFFYRSGGKMREDADWFRLEKYQDKWLFASL
jgi:hypothetical protein